VVLGGASADADAEKKIKDDFLAKMASTVVSTLNPFLKPDCKQGRITCSEDFKHLARRVTSFSFLFIIHWFLIKFESTIIFCLRAVL
jgi:hypothetical protein